MMHTLFVILPESKEIVPYLYDDQTLFGAIINDLKNKDKPSNLGLYDGNITRIMYDDPIIDLLSSRRNQILLFSFNQFPDFGSLLEAPRDQVLILILSSDLKSLIPYFAKFNDDLTRLSSELKLNLYKLDEDGKMEILGGKVEDLFSWRREQIIIFGKSNLEVMEDFSYIEGLSPDEIVSILLTLSVPEILNLCQTFSKVNEVCNNESLWKILISRDLNKEVDFNKWLDMDFSDVYLYLSKNNLNDRLEIGVRLERPSLVKKILEEDEDLRDDVQGILSEVESKDDYVEALKVTSQQVTNYYDVLKIAGQKGNRELIDSLLRRISELKLPSEEEAQYLLNTLLGAIEGRQIDIISDLLDKVYDSDIDQSYLPDLFKEVGEIGDRRIIEILINYFSNFKIIGDLLSKMIAAASRKGHQDIVKWLMTIGGKDYFEYLKEAARGGHENLFKDLISFWWKSEISSETRFQIPQLLEAAIEGGNLIIIDYVLDIIRQYHLVYQPAYLQVFYVIGKRGDLDILENVLNVFFSEEERKKFYTRQETPIISIDAIFNTIYNNILEGAAKTAQKVIVELSFPYSDPLGRSDALESAIKQGHLGIFEYLIEKGLDASKLKFLEAAAGGGNLEIFKRILNMIKTKSPWLVRPNKPTILAAAVAAARNGHKDVLEFLLDYVVKKYNEIMDSAAAGGQLEIVKMISELLIEKGTLPDYEGIMFEAIENGNYNTALLLKNLSETQSKIPKRLL